MYVIQSDINTGKNAYRLFPCGAGVLKFINEKDLIVMTHGLFQIVDMEEVVNKRFSKIREQITSLRFSIPFISRFISLTQEPRTESPHHYPPHLEKFLIAPTTPVNNVFSTLYNCVEGQYMFTLTHKCHIEMYSLVHGELEKLFQSQPQPFFKQTDIPVFAVSGNQTLLAVSMGNNTLTIYTLPGGIEVVMRTVRNFDCQIKAMGFFQNDSKLAVFVMNRHDPNDLKFFIWNLVGALSEQDEFELQDFRKSSSYLVNTQPFPIVTSAGRLVGLEQDGQILLIEDIIDSCADKQSETWKENSLFIASSRQQSRHSLVDECKEPSMISSLEFEPWHEQEQQLYCYQFKEHDLVIGLNTVQCWKREYDTRSLEYIWLVPRTLARNFGSTIISHSTIKRGELPRFVRVFLGNEREDNNMTIQLGHFRTTVYISSNASSLVDAFKALRSFDKKLQNAPKDWVPKEKTEALIEYIKLLIPRLIEETVKKPTVFRLLDARYHIVSHMLKWGFRDDVEYKILKIDEITGSIRRLHIPRTPRYDYIEKKKFQPSWSVGRPRKMKKHLSSLMIAIHMNDKPIIERLIRYYLTYATKDVSWMVSVSQALPALYRDYPKLVINMLKHEIFHAKEISLDESYQLFLPTDDFNGIRAFSINFKLFDRYRHEELYRLATNPRHRIVRKPDLKYFMVPLQDIMHSGKAQMGIWDTLINFFANQMFLDTTFGRNSPFSQLIFLDKTGEIFENPAIEAIVDFKWRKYGRILTLGHFFLYIIYAVLFVWLVYTHLDSIIYGVRPVKFFVPASSIMSVVAYTLVTSKIKRASFIEGQLLARVLYIFDFLGALLPLTGSIVIIAVQSVIKIHDKPDFCIDHSTSCKNQVILLALSCLVVWVVFFFQMRFLPLVGQYIFIIINTIVGIFGFLLSQGFIILGFAITMFMLLHFVPPLGITPGGFNSNGMFENNTAISRFSLNQTLDWTDPSDNYFYNILDSVEAVYFWISGRWDQLSNWKFWPVNFVSVLASIFLATLMQNLLIALMADSIDQAKVSNRAIVQMRAQLLTGYPEGFHEHKNVYYAISAKDWLKYKEAAEEDEHKDQFDEVGVPAPSSGSPFAGRPPTSSSNKVVPWQSLDTRLEETERSLKQIEQQLTMVLAALDNNNEKS